MNITELERKLLQAIVDSEYQTGDTKEYVVGNYVWTFSVLSGSRSDAGVASSLVKKGLARFEQSGGQGDDDRCCITEAGWEALQ